MTQRRLKPMRCVPVFEVENNENKADAVCTKDCGGFYRNWWVSEYDSVKPQPLQNSTHPATLVRQHTSKVFFPDDQEQAVRTPKPGPQGRHDIIFFPLTAFGENTFLSSLKVCITPWLLKTNDTTGPLSHNHFLTNPGLCFVWFGATLSNCCSNCTGFFLLLLF